MGEHEAAGSSRLTTWVVWVLGAGLFLAYILPAVKVRAIFSDDKNLRLADVNFFMYGTGHGWILDLGKAGIVAAIVAACAYSPRDRRTQAWLVTVGALLGLLLPIYVGSKLGSDASLGIGLWLLAVACGVSAILPWVLQSEDAKPKPELNRWLTEPIGGKTFNLAGMPFPAESSPLPVVRDSMQMSAIESNPASLLQSQHPGSAFRAVIEVSLPGFADGQSVKLTWMTPSGTGLYVGQTAAKSDGTAAFRFMTPIGQRAGTYDVRASSDNGTFSTAKVSVPEETGVSIGQDFIE